MIHYIRDKENHTIVDIEVFVRGSHPDISCSIDIPTFSAYLLSISEHNVQIEWVREIAALSEVRGFFWERISEEERNTKEKADTLVGNWCRKVCQTWDLVYVTD